MTTWMVREVVAARRTTRPVRIGIVFSATLILASSAVAGLVSGISSIRLLATPRWYATYQPAPTFDYRVLIPAVGIGLLAGALLGAIRTTDGTIDANFAASPTGNRLIAAAGTVLLLVGLATIALGHG